MNKQLVSQEALNEIINVALRFAIDGCTSPELKFLQDVCYRQRVDWGLFPQWAKASFSEDFGSSHEG